LGPAKEQTGPNMAALQSVLEEIGRRQEPGKGAPFSAQQAVWAITDQTDTSDDPEAQAILAAAGLSADASNYPGTPHFSNPNAGSPVTAAVTTTGVLPALPTVALPASGAQFGKPQRTVLSYAALHPKGFPAKRKARAQLRMFLSGGTDELRIAVQRHKGHKWRALKQFRPRTVAVAGAPTVLALRLPKMKAGDYRLRIRGTTIKKNVPLVVGKS
jgi:hypothetical protein